MKYIIICKLFLKYKKNQFLIQIKLSFINILSKRLEKSQHNGAHKVHMVRVSVRENNGH